MQGRYALEQPFSAGAQSQIYRAFDKITRSYCLLKIGSSVEREAFLSRELNHPYISKPYDFGKSNGLGTFAAYEEINERDLSHWFKTRPQEEMRKVTLRIAEFLSYIHHSGWLYNDFKPEHFLVSEESVQVLDLGLCSSLSESAGTNTYSGTFPFISPERLLGRPFDQRSDIFSFGMLLLHLFFPADSLPLEPSLEGLSRLRERVKRLRGFWKELLSEMTAWEPPQRIGTAQELWNRLLPDSAKDSFLFFPIKSKIPPAEELFGKDRIVFIESPSELTLSESENQSILAAWKAGCATATFDFRFSTVEDALFSICRCLLRETPTDTYSAIELMKNATLPSEILILFSCAETLNRKSRSLLVFALSNLTNSGCFRFLITSTVSLKRELEDGWKRLELMSTVVDQDRLRKSMFPEGSERSSPARFKDMGQVLPEQIITELQAELPRNAESSWPSAARGIRHSIGLERLTASEKRVLAAIALSGGLIRRTYIEHLLRTTGTSFARTVEKLIASGALRLRGDWCGSDLPPSTILAAFRKEQITDLAKSLLSMKAAPEDAVFRFQIALQGNENKVAADLAVMLARNDLRSGQKETAVVWAFRALQCGAKIRKKALYRIARFFLTRTDMKKTRAVLTHIRSNYGVSRRWADMLLDYYFRGYRPQRGILFAEKFLNLAAKHKNFAAESRFRLRKAQFLVMLGNLEEAEKLLSMQASRFENTDLVRGLKCHLAGLICLFKGDLAAATDYFRRSVERTHPLASSSWMNLGIAEARLGHLESAEQNLRKALELFRIREDADGLCHAYINLGILLKQKGELDEARKNYFRGLHLGRVSANSKLIVAAMSNLAMSYFIEGRTNRSLFFFRECAKFAKKKKLKSPWSSALTNAGLVFAIHGRFSRAIFVLKKAASLRHELGFVADLGSTLETIGVSYLLWGHFSNAKEYFRNAIEHFEASGAAQDRVRSTIYLALTYVRQNQTQTAADILNDIQQAGEGVFEQGLFFFTLAELMLHEREFQRTKCRDAIHSAEIFFRKAPFLYWLAKTYELKSRYLFRIDHQEQALQVMKAACDIFDRLNARKELLSIRKGEKLMSLPENLVEKIAERLPFKILQMVREVLLEKDPEEMISKILTAALEFTDMERAVLILQEDPPRIFKSTSLEDNAIREICDISFSAAKTAKAQSPLVCLNAMGDPSFSQRPSIVANQIMSIVCLPLLAKEQIVGYLYLDSREAVETLAATEKALLEIFASIIGLALNTTMILQKSYLENDALRASLGLKQEFPQIVGTGKQMMEILKIVHRLMDTDLPVLITGETGTGKELIARVLHFCGRRKNHPFVAVNCSALTESLLESELFGHERGSFTGAATTRKGVFEQARNGTLFLDEIGDMPLPMQSKFLRVLQDGEFRRVGGNETLRTNARVVLATNRNLQDLVNDKQFREDLYYRVKVAQIHLPPLRERQEDLLLLASVFLQSAAVNAKRKIRGFSPGASELIHQYPWPGNVRQLKNEIERIVALTDHEWIQVDDLDTAIVLSAGAKPSQKRDQTLREFEKSLIEERLISCDWNIVQAAKSLGVTRNGLYSKMKIYGISKKRPANPE